jgi:hypothetical protein
VVVVEHLLNAEVICGVRVDGLKILIGFDASKGNEDEDLLVKDEFEG